MKWKTALCVMMWSSAMVLAQQGPNPYGNPGMYGYTGFPMPPRGPMPPGYPYAMPPNLPMGPNLPPGPQVPYAYPPNMGNGRPMPYPFPTMTPSDPRLPGGFRPSPSMPLHQEAGPKTDAAEPYLVLPDSGPSSPSPSPSPRQTLPESRPGAVVTEPLQRFVQFVAQAPEAEPFTIYEGRRYQSETKHDNTRMWGQANFIHWWVRGQNTPPLVTTGNPNNVSPGILGNNDTVVLLGGNESIGSKELSGIQASIGVWLDAERLQSLELGGYWLGRNRKQYGFASDANGSPVLAQPIIINGNERAFAGRPAHVFRRLHHRQHCHGFP